LGFEWFPGGMVPAMLAVIFMLLAAAALWVWRIQQAGGRTRPAGDDRGGEEILTVLNARRSQLREWQPHALADLSTRVDATWRRLGTAITFDGQIRSATPDDRTGSPWVRYRGRVHGINQPVGWLGACTSRQMFLLSLDSNETRIEVDHRPLGVLTHEGKLLDPSGTLLGNASLAPESPLALQMETLRWLLGDEQIPSPIVFGNRLTAHLSCASQFSSGMRLLIPGPSTPVLRLECEPQNPQQHDWLLAIAVLAVARVVMRSAWAD